MNHFATRLVGSFKSAAPTSIKAFWLDIQPQVIHDSRKSIGFVTLLTKTQHEFLTRFIIELRDSPAATEMEDKTRFAIELQAAGLAWEQAREAGSRDLANLISGLLVKEDPDLAEVAVLVGKLAGQLPGGLAAELDTIAQQYQAGNTEPAQPRGLATARDYLKRNEAALTRCENNPIGVSVNIREPLAAALDQVERTLNTLRSP